MYAQSQLIKTECFIYCQSGTQEKNTNIRMKEDGSNHIYVKLIYLDNTQTEMN